MEVAPWLLVPSSPKQSDDIMRFLKLWVTALALVSIRDAEKVVTSWLPREPQELPPEPVKVDEFWEM